MPRDSDWAARSSGRFFQLAWAALVDVAGGVNVALVLLKQRSLRIRSTRAWDLPCNASDLVLLRLHLSTHRSAALRWKGYRAMSSNTGDINMLWAKPF